MLGLQRICGGLDLNYSQFVGQGLRTDLERLDAPDLARVVERVEAAKRKRCGDQEGARWITWRASIHQLQVV